MTHVNGSFASPITLHARHEPKRGCGERGRNRHGMTPYVEAGVTHLKIFDTSDGAVADFEAVNGWGALAQGDLAYRITRHLGGFFDVKKYIGRTSTSSYGPCPTTRCGATGPVCKNRRNSISILATQRNIVASRRSRAGDP